MRITAHLVAPILSLLTVAVAIELPAQTPAAESEDAWQEAVEIGNGWHWLPWFGRFQGAAKPWIFHEDHGWLYLGAGNLNTGQRIFDASLGWLWTSRSVYPNFYSFTRKDWMRYDRTSAGPRRFFDHATNRAIAVGTKSDDELDFNHRYNGFNVSVSSIPLDLILPGGPARDGIPALTDPKFVPIHEVDFMKDDDILVSVTTNGETRGYPFRILNWHEVVNDQVGDDAFVVSYCPLCGTAFVFDADVDGVRHHFGVSGLLFQNNLLMYDQETESLWSQFALQGVSGRKMGAKLTWRFSRQMTWRDWKREFSGGKLMSNDTGFDRFFFDYNFDPYGDYAVGDGPRFPTQQPVRDDLPAMEWIWGVTVGDVAKAYPLNRLPDSLPIRDNLNGARLELVLDADARSVRVTNLDTRTPLDNGVGAFWFSWQDFFPDTEVFDTP